MAAIGLLVAQPQLAISLANMVQKEVVLEADVLDISLLPPALSAEQLTVQGAFGEAKSAKLDLAIDHDAWSDDLPFWAVDASGVSYELAPPQDVKSSTETDDAFTTSSLNPVLLAWTTIKVREFAFAERSWDIDLTNINLSNEGGPLSVGLLLKEGNDLLKLDAQLQSNPLLSEVQYQITSASTAQPELNATILGADGIISFSPVTIDGLVDDLQIRFPPSAKEPPSQAEPAEATPLFSDTPLSDTPLLGADIEINQLLKSVQIDQIEFSDINIAFRGSQTELRLQEFAGKVADGQFSANGKLTQAGHLHTGDLQISASELVLERFGLVGQETLTGGDGALALELASNGSSIAELAANLAGETTVVIRDATLQSSAIDGIGSDVLVETANKLNPFHKEDPSTQVVCAFLRFTAEQGVLTSARELVLETDKMKIVGDGKVSLTDESVNLTLSPSAREGVGLNLGGLVKFVKLGGTIRNPVPEVDALGVLQSGAAVGAALSTGGLSVLAEGLAKRVVNAGSACDNLPASG